MASAAGCAGRSDAWHPAAGSRGSGGAALALRAQFPGCGWQQWATQARPRPWCRGPRRGGGRLWPGSRPRSPGGACGGGREGGNRTCRQAGGAFAGWVADRGVGGGGGGGITAHPAQGTALRISRCWLPALPRAPEHQHRGAPPRQLRTTLRVAEAPAHPALPSSRPGGAYVERDASYSSGIVAGQPRGQPTTTQGHA